MSKVHVEVCISNENKMQLEGLAQNLTPHVRQYLIANKNVIKFNVNYDVFKSAELSDVKGIVVECEQPMQCLSFCDVDLNDVVYNFYRPVARSGEVELFDENDEGASCDDKSAVQASNHWLLPATKFLGLWENLIYDVDVKEKILRYCLAAIVLGQHHVNSNIVACNRLILLHGPPGTGKTSLCKAIAQKLSIRMRSTFRNTHLIEINSHSLFSKWFSESGKLVMRLFEKIRELIADPKNLVCVLIDEVESLAYARDSMSAQEPKDAMRVVNALLTQLDNIREHPNVLILATSNLAKTIDLAFMDRADVKQFIGFPCFDAKHGIFSSIIKELIRAGVIEETSEDAISFHASEFCKMIQEFELNGRTIRKIPFLAFANMDMSDLENGKISCEKFVNATRKIDFSLHSIHNNDK